MSPLASMRRVIYVVVLVLVVLVSVVLVDVVLVSVVLVEVEDVLVVDDVLLDVDVLLVVDVVVVVVSVVLVDVDELDVDVLVEVLLVEVLLLVVLEVEVLDEDVLEVVLVEVLVDTHATPGGTTMSEIQTRTAVPKAGGVFTAMRANPAVEKTPIVSAVSSGSPSGVYDPLKLLEVSNWYSPMSPVPLMREIDTMETVAPFATGPTGVVLLECVKILHVGVGEAKATPLSSRRLRAIVTGFIVFPLVRSCRQVFPHGASLSRTWVGHRHFGDTCPKEDQQILDWNLRAGAVQFDIDQTVRHQDAHLGRTDV